MMSERDAVKGNVLVSVCAIIKGENHVILLIWEGDMPYHKLWVFPGGFIKPKETVKQAIVREVREETGLEVLPTKLIGVYDDSLLENDELTHHIIIAYEAIVIGGRIIITHEATEYAWMGVEEALNHPQIPNIFKKILDDFNKQKSIGFVSRLRKFLHIQPRTGEV
jgi:ADP-ribose pyrophosphatase YjhB (NUDIX family)